MVVWAVQAAIEAGATQVIVVVGHGRQAVEAELSARFATAKAEVTTVVQAEQRGTGHAARCAAEQLPDDDTDVVLTYGDVPLLEASALGKLVALRRRTDAALALLTCRAADPTGYGRVLRRADASIVGIREHRDCGADELRIDEVNPGVYAAKSRFLLEALAALKANNAAGELYLTDVVAAAGAAGGAVGQDWPLESLMGVNDRAQLAEASAVMRRRIAKTHAQAGVSIRDLSAVYIDAEVEIDVDAVLEPMVCLRGRCRIGRGARIDVGSVLEDCEVEAGAELKPYTVASDAHIGAQSSVGPFSHLRPGSELGPEVRVGNFVEVKKTKLARGAKASHLAYLGDGIVGEDVNIGAGTIFCNYDGVNKHVTVLEDGAFIGSDSQLVAPVRVGAGAYVATGTTLTRDVPANALAVGRARQSNKEGYADRLRARMRAQSKK